MPNSPTMQQIFESMKDSLANSPLTLNSIYGILIIAFIVLIIVALRKALHYAAGIIFGWLFAAELLHIFAFYTAVGAEVPILQTLFKYDVLTAIAQLFPNTAAADGLMWCQSFLTTILVRFGAIIVYVAKVITHNFSGTFDAIKSIADK